MSTQRTPRPFIIEGPLAKIPLGIDAKDGYAIIDADLVTETLEAYKWSLSGNGYPATNITGGRLHLHSYIMKDQRKEGLFVDHINGDRLDNRRSNLRIVTKQQNSMNRVGNKGKLSRHKGITYYKVSDRWQVRIVANEKVIALGYYKKERDAAEAYNRAALKYHGEFARLNILDSDDAKELS